MQHFLKSLTVVALAYCSSAAAQPMQILDLPSDGELRFNTAYTLKWSDLKGDNVTLVLENRSGNVLHTWSSLQNDGEEKFSIPSKHHTGGPRVLKILETGQNPRIYFIDVFIERKIPAEVKIIVVTVVSTLFVLGVYFAGYSM